MDWGFTEKINNFIEVAITIPPDVDKIRAMLTEGIDINCMNIRNDETLFYCILDFYGEYCGGITKPRIRGYYPEDGCLTSFYDTTHLIELINIFLEFGADLSLEGDYGCILDAFIHGANDENALLAVEILLENGANPNVTDCDNENICDRVNCEDSMAGLLWDEDHSKPGLPDFYERFCKLLAKYGGRPNVSIWPY